MTPKDLINQIFLGEYASVVDQHAYISFALIGLGIEFLGACMDRYDFGERGKSSKRFAAAMKLFPSAYQGKNLCDDLRNGFAHQFRPGMSLELTTRKEASLRGWKHLEKTSGGQLCLVVEDLYENFCTACHEVLRQIDDGTLSHTKLKSQFLRV